MQAVAVVVDIAAPTQVLADPLLAARAGQVLVEQAVAQRQDVGRAVVVAPAAQEQADLDRQALYC